MCGLKSAHALEAPNDFGRHGLTQLCQVSKGHDFNHQVLVKLDGYFVGGFGVCGVNYACLICAAMVFVNHFYRCPNWKHTIFLLKSRSRLARMDYAPCA